MSYEPTLIVNLDHLEKYIEGLDFDFLRHMDYNDLSRTARVEKYLIDIMDQERSSDQNITIGGVRLIVLNPELTSFNSDVREVLTEADIEYGIDN